MHLNHCWKSRMCRFTHAYNFRWVIMLVTRLYSENKKMKLKMTNKSRVKYKFYYNKCSSYRCRELGPELIPLYRESTDMWLLSHPDSRLPLLSARPAVTFPAKERHRPSTSTKLYCSVTEAHRCEKLVQGCYAALSWGNWTHDILIATLLRHHLSL